MKLGKRPSRKSPQKEGPRENQQHFVMKGDSGGAILDVTIKKQVGVVSWGSEMCVDYPGGMLHL